MTQVIFWHRFIQYEQRRYILSLVQINVIRTLNFRSLYPTRIINLLMCLLNVSISFERSFVLEKSKTDSFILACVLAYHCKITTVCTAETTITPFADKTLTSAPRLSPRTRQNDLELQARTSTIFYQRLYNVQFILNSLCLQLLVGLSTKVPDLHNLAYDTTYINCFTIKTLLPA